MSREGNHSLWGSIVVAVLVVLFLIQCYEGLIGDYHRELETEFENKAYRDWGSAVQNPVAKIKMIEKGYYEGTVSYQLRMPAEAGGIVDFSYGLQIWYDKDTELMRWKVLDTENYLGSQTESTGDRNTNTTVSDMSEYVLIDDDTVLEWIQKGENEKVESAIKSGLFNVNFIAENQDTPLSAAIIHNNFGIIKALINAGVDINQRGPEGSSPLFIAATSSGAVDIIQILIKTGADVNHVADNGASVLLGALIADQQPDVISALIAAKADVNFQGPSGMTPLMVAAALTSNSEIVADLLDAGADIKTLDDHGNTALFYAEKNEDPGIRNSIMEILTK